MINFIFSLKYIHVKRSPFSHTRNVLRNIIVGAGSKPAQGMSEPLI